MNPDFFLVTARNPNGTSLARQIRPKRFSMNYLVAVLSLFAAFAQTVEAACTAPVISSGPNSTTACVGSSASFSVTFTGGSGGAVLYQWRRNGASISGATLSSYTIASV